jgi:Arc/MetJ-type ribon-helix-helix transcriptional regulator
MDVPLKPELAEFVAEQVRAGRYPSEVDVIEAAVARLMLDAPVSEDELDAETLAAIDEADAQIDRGEGMDVDEAFARLRAKHCPPEAP